MAIEPCPPIRPGPGHVVTGTFAHEPSDNLIDIYIEGDPDPIGCTPNHPFWSETRDDFVQAAELQSGEEVWTATEDLLPVAYIAVRPKSERVYNLEVQGEHVYQVGKLGVLVHNAGGQYLGGRRSFSSNSSIPKKSWTRIFGKAKSWASARRSYWKKRGPGGKAPRRRVQVKDHKTGKKRIVEETKELHHVEPRRNGGSNDFDNLEEVWPTEHAAKDSYRHTGYDVIKVLKYL